MDKYFMLDILFPLSEQFLQLQERPYVRYFLQQHSLTHRLSIIQGQRGVGKSTTMIQALLQAQLPAQQILYVPVDHFLVKNFSLYEIAETFSQHGGKIICFDEIHKYSNWSQELKSIYDTFPHLKVFASGSSALAIQRGSHDLARRAIVYTMFGMSFREYIGLTHDITLNAIPLKTLLSDHVAISQDIINQLREHHISILALFADYIRYGYYPYSVEFDEENLFYLTIEQNVHTTLESDLPAIYTNLSGASVNKMKRLLAFLSTHVPFVTDMQALKTLLEIGDERTLKNYLQLLDAAGTITLLHANDKKLHGMKKPDKIYPNNTCQLFALRANQAVDRGTLREVFFISMLKAQYSVNLSLIGDFLIDQQYIFEVGGKNKDFNQIKNKQHAYLAVDDIEQGFGNKIPLWMLGFLY